MYHEFLREVSYRGALTRLAAFSYLALGVSWLLACVFSPEYDNFDRHPGWLVASCVFMLITPLMILFARSESLRLVGIVLLFIAFLAWVFQPDGGLQEV